MPHLYSYEGQFVFAKGFNWARLIAWDVGWGSRYSPAFDFLSKLYGAFVCDENLDSAKISTGKIRESKR